MLMPIFLWFNNYIELLIQVFKSFVIWKTVSKLAVIYAQILGRLWPGWIVLIKSEILVMAGMVWLVSSDKWKAPLA